MNRSPQVGNDPAVRRGCLLDDNGGAQFLTVLDSWIEGDVIGHFHSAGVPGRHGFFPGEVNYPFVPGQVGKLGYQGVFGFDYAPAMDRETSLKQTLAYLAKGA